MISPTEGVVVGDEQFYLANSQQNSLDADGRIWADEKLSMTHGLKSQAAKTVTTLVRSRYMFSHLITAAHLFQQYKKLSSLEAVW